MSASDPVELTEEQIEHLKEQFTDPVELTEEQIEQVKEVFMLFDQNGDETITINELGTVMRALGQYPTEEEMRQIIAEIDADGNGIIEFPEICDLMARRPWGMLGSQDELRTAFRPFDYNGDGFLSAAELRRALTTQGEKLTDQQLDEMMKDFPVDGDGMVKYEDFVQKLMS